MSIEEKKIAALLEGAKLMEANGLGDWFILFTDVTTYHAQCRYRQKAILFNIRSLTVMTKEQFIGTMYHEIAHALVGAWAGHGRTFKEKYYELSGNMDHAGYAYKLDTKLRRFILNCTRCGSDGSTNSRRPRYCRSCSTTSNYVRMQSKPNELVLLEWA